MRVGILETGDVHPNLRARHGDYPEMFEALLSAADPTLEFTTVRILEGARPAAPDAADAWLVTGSRHGVYDDLPWIDPLKTFLRDCVAAGVPVVGICFGHQILAEALGGRAVKSERGWGIGVQDYRILHRPSWMPDVPEHFAMRAVHQDQVVELPETATLLARSDHCPIAAVVYGDPEAPVALTVQPHPEFGPEFADDLIALRRGTVFPEDTADVAREGIHGEVHSVEWARLIVDFLHRAHGARRAA